MPRRNKPHSERRRKTKNYRNKHNKFHDDPKAMKSKGKSWEDDYSWEEELSDRYEDAGRKGY